MDPLKSGHTQTTKRLPLGRIPLVKAISTLVGLPLFVLLLYVLPILPFAILISVVATLGVWEFARLTGIIHVDRWWLAMLGGGLPMAMLVVPLGMLPLLVYGVLLAILGSELLSRRPGQHGMQRVAIGSLTILYAAWLLSFVVLLRNMPAGREISIWLFLATWGGDLGAGVVGILLGRHHLPARINIRKTYEGIAGGVVLSALVTWLLAPAVIVASSGMLLLIGMLLGVAGQLGDLCESVLKRSVGATDSGVFIPGQGGILDRIDSLLFTAPLLYGLLMVV